MNASKLLTLLIWIACGATLFVNSDSFYIRGGQIIFWILLVGHCIECAAYLPTMRRVGGSMSMHIVQTLLFGIVYYRELKSRELTQDGSPTR